MKRHGVGAIPVVLDRSEPLLEGIVTDRDLCCDVVACASIVLLDTEAVTAVTVRVIATLRKYCRFQGIDALCWMFGAMLIATPLLLLWCAQRFLRNRHGTASGNCLHSGTRIPAQCRKPLFSRCV